MQTFAQTINFVAAGFSPLGLTLDIDGTSPFRVVYEFPIYQSIVGVLFMLFGNSILAGKIVSLVAAVMGVWLALRFARERWGDAIAFRAGLCLVSSPIALLVSASFQPDALALALGAASGWALALWREKPTFSRWCLFVAGFSAAALAKFTVLIPFLPLVALLVFRRRTGWQSLSVAEWLSGLLLFLVPFVAWNLHRGTLMDPRYLVGERNVFLVGDLGRFLRAGFYAKPAFIIGAMALCGAAVPLVVIGLRKLDDVGLALVGGIPLYYVLIPTVADQTYYAWPLVPVLALLAARGMQSLELAVASGYKGLVQVVIAVAWIAGFSVAAPYTLRHDNISLEAAYAARDHSEKGDLLMVMNMHDRGVAIGEFNPTIITLAERRGWNVNFNSTDVPVLRSQIERRRREGAKWLVTTWYTPDLEPWFSPLLPERFGRQPQFRGERVNGQAIVQELARDYPVTTRGANFAILQISEGSTVMLSDQTNRL